MISKNQIKFVRQLEQKKYRKKEGLFVAEGPKVVGDLLRAGFKAHTIFATSEWESQGQTFQEVSDEELRRVSFLQHPQRVLALFFIPTESVPSVSTIYCSENTADAWSPKVVQATMGSIARVNIIYTDLQELISKAQVPVYGTLLDGQDIYTQELSKEGIIVMGNEGNGISAPIRKLINRRLLIPQFHEGPESLNVAIATAITCSEFRRRYPL